MIHEARLVETGENGTVRCRLCAHRCSIAPGRFGICNVRENRGGTLMTHAYGELVAANVDPIEKKPLFHFLPGTTSMSIAAAGCNFRCGFCQNWEISQAPEAAPERKGGRETSPAAVVRAALDQRCRSISYTYTEPTIFFEFAYDTAKAARAAGLANVFVTNGYMTAEALETIRPYLDAANVDLKAFRDETYKKVCGARLQPVLDSIRLMRKLGIWVEVTTLVVPGMNDGEDELKDIARFLAGVDPALPWHISRFHPDYRLTEAPPTPVTVLRKARRIGREAGLAFVYVGNIGDEGEDTLCPGCGRMLIKRRGFGIEANAIISGACPACGTAIAGRF
jgi:pyruvate formate lyase activating enzyme